MFKKNGDRFLYGLFKEHLFANQKLKTVPNIIENILRLL